jgi:hypothetical protein
MLNTFTHGTTINYLITMCVHLSFRNLVINYRLTIDLLLVY